MGHDIFHHFDDHTGLTTALYSLSFQRFADLNAAALDLAKWLTYAESYPTMLRRPIEMVGAFTRARDCLPRSNTGRI
jgi:hypothetical protein